MFYRREMVTAAELQARFPEELGTKTTEFLDGVIAEARFFVGPEPVWGDRYDTAIKYAAGYLAVGGTATGITSATAGPVSVSYEPGGKGAGFLRMLHDLRQTVAPAGSVFSVSRLSSEPKFYG